MTDLQQRASYYKGHYAIRATGDGYKLTEQDSYFSDSHNPKGEYRTCEMDIRTCKTKSGAIKGLRKEIECHFPSGHDIEGIIIAIATEIN